MNGHPHMTVASTPSLPAPYVSGKLELERGEVNNLLELIQDQITRNCPSGAVELRLWADAANMGSVMVGSASNLQGRLDQETYGYKLTPASPAQVYRSTYPGSSVPIGDLQVMAPSGGGLHVELWT